MKTFFSAPFAVAYLLLLVQFYLLIYFSLFVLRRLKLLKKPYGGMDYSEALPAGFILLGVLFLSSANIPGIVQAVKFYAVDGGGLQDTFPMFFARSFVFVLLFVVFFIILNSMNIRYLFRGQFREPTLVVSILLCAVAVGLAGICWSLCRELIDNMTPKFINFQ